MKTTYTVTVIARCPVNNEKDVYTVTLKSGQLLKVEDIKEYIDSVTKEPIFQEHLTQAIHRHFGCTVKTVGTHSGVKTKVVCK